MKLVAYRHSSRIHVQSLMINGTLLRDRTGMVIDMHRLAALGNQRLCAIIHSLLYRVYSKPCPIGSATPSKDLPAHKFQVDLDNAEKAPGMIFVSIIY